MPLESLNTELSVAELFAQQPPLRPRPIYRSGDSCYYPVDYGWSYDEISDFPAGKYFLGDPSFSPAQQCQKSPDVLSPRVC